MCEIGANCLAGGDAMYGGILYATTTMRNNDNEFVIVGQSQMSLKRRKVFIVGK